jgi:transcriptional regulator with XRE-family HTH domain
MQTEGIPQPGEAEQRALGRAVRELRARRSLSQEGLARRSRLHRNYVGAMERGELNPTFRTMLKFTDGLALPLAELVEVYERQLAYERQLRDAF